MSTAARQTIEAEIEEIERHREARERAADNLALLVLAEREHGETVRSLAERYGVTASAVHTWTQRGRELRKLGAYPVRRKVGQGSPVMVLPVALQWTLTAVIVLEVILHILGIIGWVSL